MSGACWTELRLSRRSLHEMKMPNEVATTEVPPQNKNKSLNDITVLHNLIAIEANSAPKAALRRKSADSLITERCCMIFGLARRDPETPQNKKTCVYNMYIQYLYNSCPQLDDPVY